MKKLLLCLATLFSLTLCFGFKSAAYSEQDLTNLRSIFYNNYGIQLNQGIAEAVLNKWDDNNNNYLVLQKTSSFYGFVVGTDNGSNSTQYKLYGVKGIANDPTTETGLTNYTWTANPTNYNVDIGAGAYKLGPWSSWHTVPIDWDTVYYSANILPPDIDITYRELSSVPIVDVPLNVELTAEPQNVYVEIGAIFDCPDEVDAYSDNGRYTYNTLDTTGFAMTIIDKEDLVLASNASSSYIHLALNEAWQDVYDQIPISDITWHTDPNYSTALVNNMKSRFENIRKVCCFYGNELRLFVRYFVINNNTQFVVGSWRVWYSKTPNSFTDQTPTWYQPYIQASGTTGTSTNTGSNTQQDPDVITIPPGTGDPTGIYYNPTTNITVGSNVPNYPDYPTIRSYNADNFLVQTMNYLDYLNDPTTEHDLFGEFGSFFENCFCVHSR